MAEHQCAGSHGPPMYSVYQSLDELSFEKGIWGAAFDGNIEKLKTILQTEDPSKLDSSGYTALHYAARNGREEVCRVLLEGGANPNVQTPGGATPLHRAAYLGHSKIVNLLLRHKADPAIFDSDGKNALHKAAEGHHFAVAKMLVNSNPELKSMKDNKDCLPLIYSKNNTNLITLLTP